MSYTKLLERLKGSARSGNFAHVGRPGKLGGSGKGGGFGRLSNYKPDDDPAAIRRKARIAAAQRKFTEVTSDELVKHYDLTNNCGVKFDCTALEDYTGFRYEKINSQLRSGEITSTKEEIAAMDEVFNKSAATPKDLVTYRGFNYSVLKGLQPGDVFQDNGFVSTSIDYNSAFAGAQAKIFVPKGSKAVYVEDISAVPTEKELLLNRGSKFKILDIKYNDYDSSVRHVTMELIK